MTPAPTALFKSGFMRKPDKPAILKKIIKNVPSVPTPEVMIYVLDGGALLHRVRWIKKANLGDILNQYVKYIKSCFPSKVHIVFDGYTSNHTTKDHEHKRHLFLGQ